MRIMGYEQTKLNNLLDSISRRRWLIWGGLLLGATCGLLLYLTLDKVYESEARLSFQQQVSLSQPAQGQKIALEDVIHDVSTEVKSRPNLESLIGDHGLHSDLLVKKSMEDVVEEVRENLNIVQSPNGDSLTIQYSGVDPVQVARVANVLADSFIQQSSEYQRERILDLITAQKKEQGRVEEILVKKEAAMRDYRKIHYNELPTQQPINKARLAALQDEYQVRQESIQDLERRRAEIEEKIITVERLIIEKQEQADAQPKDTSININQRTTLEMLQNSLAEVRDNYSEQHPMVQRLKNQIASLKELIAEDERLENERRSEVQERNQFDDELLSLRTQLEEIGLNADELKKQNQEIQLQISKYQEWINRAPAREAEWSALMQEYAKLKQQHDALASQDFQAASTLNLEGGGAGSQFSVKDKARRPATPIKPDFIIFIIVSSFAGLVGGGMIAVGLEGLDNTIKDKKALEQTLNLPVICTVPNLPLTSEIKKKRLFAYGRVGFFLLWFSMFCVATAIMARQGKLVSSLF